MKAKKAFDRFAEAKLDALKAVPFDNLSEYKGKVYHWNEMGRHGTVGIAVETVDEDTLRVIVQGHLPVLFIPFLLQPFLDGFRKSRDGRVEQVEYEEISHFD